MSNRIAENIALQFIIVPIMAVFGFCIGLGMVPLYGWDMLWQGPLFAIAGYAVFCILWAAIGEVWRRLS